MGIMKMNHNKSWSMTGKVMRAKIQKAKEEAEKKKVVARKQERLLQNERKANLEFESDQEYKDRMKRETGRDTSLDWMRKDLATEASLQYMMGKKMNTLPEKKTEQTGEQRQIQKEKEERLKQIISNPHLLLKLQKRLQELGHPSGDLIEQVRNDFK